MALTHQFHDVIPGTCIKMVYDVTYKEYAWIKEKGESYLTEILQKLLSFANIS